MKKLFSKITASVLSVLFAFTNTPLNIANAENNFPESNGIVPVRIVDEDGNEIIPNLIPDFDLRALNLPEKFDLRDYGFITPVKAQGSTGTCWAHSALASIESNMIMKGLADNSIDLSEAHLAWFGRCAYSTDINDPLYHEGCNYGKEGYNKGGNALIVQNTLARGTGVQLESNFPNVTKMPSIDESKRYTSYGYLTNSDELDPKDFDSVKQHLMTSGALYLSYYDAMSNGVNPYMSSGYGVYCPDGSQSENHGVTIVGWDDNFYDFVDKPEGKGAWIIKNSWGTSFADEGYFYLSYYDKTISSIASFEVESNDKFDNIYQYDGISMIDNTVPEWIYSKSKGISGANIFTAKGNEEITSVSFYTFDASVPYTISVYTNVTEGNPTSGNLIYTQDGSALYKGYHLIDLGKAVSVKKDTKFSVVVTLKKRYTYLYTDTKASSGNSSFYSTYNLSTNKNEGWVDCNKERSVDVCIKAFSKSTDTYIPNCSKTGQHIYGDWTMNDAKSHSRNCLECNKTETNSHSLANWIDNDDGTHIRLCPDCGYSESEKHILSKLTSDNNSTHSESCTVCNYINKNEHTFTDWTDSKDGENHTKKCTVCNQAVTEKHNMSNWIDNGNGTHSRSCTVCGYTETENHEKSSIVADNNLIHTVRCSLCGYANKSEHNFTDWKDDENGRHFKKCLDCNFFTSEKHSFTEWTDNKDGTHSRGCKICEYVETESHSLNPLSADNDSTHSESCTLCGYVNESEHSFGKWTDNKDGVNHIKKCKECGQSITEKHTMTKWTDNKDGTHSRKCSVCGYSETAEHSFGDWEYTKDKHSRSCKDCGATESAEHKLIQESTTDSSHTFVCRICNYKVTDKHDFTDWTINNTEHSRTCKICDYELSEKHYFDDWKDNEDGTHSHSCFGCGYSETAEHNFPDWKSNKKGEHYHYCNDCKKYESEKHDFVRSISPDGTITSVCSVCGHKETSKVEFIRGDMDGSKKIDVFDMILMRMAYMNGLKNDTDILSADMNGDGKFNISDLVSLNKFILNG